MRPFDEIPFEESDYSDVALMVASAREWPADDFARELDARVARRFAEEGQDGGRRGLRRSIRLPLWSAGPAVALVAGIVAAVVVVSGGGLHDRDHPRRSGRSHVLRHRRSWSGPPGDAHPHFGHAVP